MNEYNIDKIYAKYKEFIANNVDTKVKEAVNKIVEQRHLSSVMNDTKWLKLQAAILSTPNFEPAYEVQLLTDDVVRSPIFEKVPTYLGDWELIYENYEFSLPAFFNIEWIAIHPRLAKYRGRLIEAEIIDKTSVLSEILQRCNIPFEKEDEYTFIIYGYK